MTRRHTTRRFAILTGEYPPAGGGVSDYTRILAGELHKCGQEVHVFAPATHDPQISEEPTDEGAVIHWLANGFSMSSLPDLSRRIDELGDVKLLVQYVPHAFGYRAMNLPFCLWLKKRSARNYIMTMFHEVAYPFLKGQTFQRHLLAGVNRAMAGLVGSASARVFVSIPGWIPILEAVGVEASRIEVAPIFSNLPVWVDANRVALLRQSLSPDGLPIMGHFGSPHPATAELLHEVIAGVLQSERVRLLLVGRGCEQTAHILIDSDPSLAPRIIIGGALPAEQLAIHLAACDLMLQVYPDGVSGRRGTLLGGLALGAPIVTNLGVLSESFWAQSGAVALADKPDAIQIIQTARRVLADPRERAQLADNARLLYAERFEVLHTVNKLLRAAATM